MPRIISVDVKRECVLLKQPYLLSFVTLEAFDALICYLKLDSGEIRIGEVVPLPGYSSESVEDVLRVLEAWLPDLAGQEPHIARSTIADQISVSPCAASVLLSALDVGFIAENSPEKKWHTVPLVYPTSSAASELTERVKEAVLAGYKTIKVKIGDSLDQDLAALPQLRAALSPDIRVRFDANQAYTLAAAKKFLAAVEVELVEATELVEQPLLPHAWDEMADLCGHTSLPLMLDESIYTIDDVAQAAEIGCQWIKLKLFKQGGLHEVVQLAQYATDLGLKVVLGNGVATDISNMLELSIYDRHQTLFTGASESNGFVKLHQPLVYTRLRVESGCAVWH